MASEGEQVNAEYHSGRHAGGTEKGPAAQGTLLTAHVEDMPSRDGTNGLVNGPHHPFPILLRCMFRHLTVITLLRRHRMAPPKETKRQTRQGQQPPHLHLQGMSTTMGESQGR